MAQNATQQKTGETNPRGIRNAQVRHAERREGQTLQKQLLRKMVRGKGHQAANDSTYARSADERQGVRVGVLSDADVRALFSDVANDINDTELNEIRDLKITKQEHPSFPYLITAIAVIKDILDFGDLTLIGVVITTVLSFCISIILFFWILGKMGGEWWKKKLIQKILIRYGIVVALEFIPFFKMIPATTIFVLMVHFDETKIVKLLNGALERLRGKSHHSSS
jgi:hypothetical protein